MALRWKNYAPETEGRAILHLNVADFAVAVERVVEPGLKGRPVIIAAQGASRAAVYDMSDEAYQAGVRKGLALKRARRLCPEARILPPHPDRYERAMLAFFQHTLPYSPLIEAEEINGHLFMDLTGTGRLFGPPPDVAWRIRKAVRSNLSLDPIWSLAPNKLVAKAASRIVKPVGEYIVEPGEEEEFLRPLPLHLLPGLEREDLIRFGEFHINRVGQAAGWTAGQLDVVFGRRGRDIHRAVRGLDGSPVRPAGRKKPEMSLDREFGDDTNDEAVIEASLYRLAEQAGLKLREQSLAARRVTITIDYSDGARAIRQKTDTTGTANDFKLFALARGALDLAWTRRVRLRRLRLTCDRLAYPPAQMELFPMDTPETGLNGRLLKAMDQIRDRLGPTAIRVGRGLEAC